ncbi:MAG: DUF1559 domain-containing protein [Phycisphaerales bacterium JB065]
MTSSHTPLRSEQVHRGCSAARRSGRGFSLVDLLVSLAVIATLISILLPSLSKAQEAARRVGCASNMRQIGMALQMYAYEHGDRLPPSEFLDEDSRDYSPQDTIFIYLSENATEDRVVVEYPNRWDGLGQLYAGEYLDAAQAFYCPSHTGDHAFDHYKSLYDEHDGDIATNYQYRLPQNVRYFTDYRNSTTLLADAMRTQFDYNHQVGNYMFKADLSVTWFSDVDGRLLASLPGDLVNPSDAVSAMETAWELLDSKGSSDFDGPNHGGGGDGMPGGPIAGGGNG